MTDPSQTVLVTGGAGFIGSHLVDRLLAEGRRVVVADDLSTGRLANLEDARRVAPGSFEFQRLDVTSGALTPVAERHRPEVIVHLATRRDDDAAAVDPMGRANVNVLGTLAVLEAALAGGTRKVVFASAADAIYAVDAPAPLDEAAPGPAPSHYGAALRAAEEYLGTYGQLYGLQWTSLALASVYGPRQGGTDDGGGVVGTFTERMLRRQPCIVHGDGSTVRDFVFVDDVVHAFVLAMDRGDGQRINIGTGEGTAIGQLYRALAAAIGYDRQPVPAPPRELDAPVRTIDPRRASQELGWKPWTTLEEGLAETLRWAVGAAVAR